MSLKDYIFLPEKDPELFQFYKKQEACDWSAEEMDFTKEKDDYLSSPKTIQTLFKKIIGFFLIGDGLISEALIKYLAKAVEEKNWPKVFYISMQLKIENTHAETYSKAALTIVPKEEHDEIITMCLEKPCLKEKGEWIQKHCDNPGNEFCEKVSCAIGEGVFFVAQFAVIFYMRRLNKFKNFIFSNEQISKDETLHRNEKCHEAKVELIKNNYPKDDVGKAIQLIMDGVVVEKKFAADLLEEPIMGKQADLDAGFTLGNIERFIESLADQICYLIGIPLIYKVSIELLWMVDINLSQKTNFFELDNVGSYRKLTPKDEDKKEDEKEIDLDNVENIDF